MREQLGYQRANCLEKLAIDRVVISFAAYYLSLIKLTHAEPGSIAGKGWLEYHTQTAKLYDAAMKTLYTLRRWMPRIQPIVQAVMQPTPTPPAPPRKATQTARQPIARSDRRPRRSQSLTQH